MGKPCTRQTCIVPFGFVLSIARPTKIDGMAADYDKVLNHTWDYHQFPVVQVLESWTIRVR